MHGDVDDETLARIFRLKVLLRLAAFERAKEPLPPKLHSAAAAAAFAKIETANNRDREGGREAPNSFFLQADIPMLLRF